MSVKTYLTNNQDEIKKIAKALINKNALTHLESLVDTEFSRITNKLVKEYSPVAKTVPLSHILNPNKSTDTNIKEILKAKDDAAKPLYFKAESTNKGSKCKPYRIPVNLAPKTSWLAEIASTGQLTGITQKELDKATTEAKSRLKNAAIIYGRTTHAEKHYNNIITKINTNNTFDEYVHAAEAEYGKNGINHHTGKRQPYRATNQKFPAKFLSPLEFSPSILNEELENEVLKYKKNITAHDEQKLKYRLPALQRTLDRVKPIAENDVVENAVYAAIHEHIRNNTTIIPPIVDIPANATNDKPKTTYNPPEKPAETIPAEPVKNETAPQTNTPSIEINNENKVNNNPVINAPVNVPLNIPQGTIEDKVKPEQPDKTAPKGGIFEIPNEIRKDISITCEPKGGIYTVPDAMRKKQTTKPEGGIYTIPEIMRETDKTNGPKGGIYTIIDEMRKLLDGAKDKIAPEEQDVVKNLYDSLDNAYKPKDKEEQKTQPTLQTIEEKVTNEKSTNPDLVVDNTASEVRNLEEGGGIKRTITYIFKQAFARKGEKIEPDYRADYRPNDGSIHNWLENMWIDAHNSIVKAWTPK